MSEKAEMEHLDRARLSALLDASGEDAAGAAHLEACARCRAEFESLSRMRMALSGLGGLEPPPDEWSRIEAAVEERGMPRAVAPGAEEGRPTPGSAGSATGARRPRAVALALLSRWPVQAAAGLLLFGGGILAGLQLTAGGPAGEGRVAGGLPAATADAGAAGYLDALEELERLGAPGPAREADGLDPGAAAERLARLEALIRASREAVGESPADPLANALLFRLVEERDYVASRFNESLRLVTLEYR